MLTAPELSTSLAAMRATALSRLTATTLATLLVCAPLSPAWGFLGLFNKEKNQKAPSGSGELQAQEAAAAALLQDAQGASSGKATSIYDEVLKKYPFTNAAAEAAYAKALIVRQNGKLRDAFDAFQALVDRYRQSPRFADAIQQQYEIAEEAKGGKKQRTVLLVVSMKLGAGEVIELYKQVIDNAPYGKFAPLAQFSIAEIHQEEGEKSAAVNAYQAVVDNYPSSKEAAEAQFRIGAISNIAAQKTQDSQNLVATRDALQSYVATNPTGERSGEAAAMLAQVDEETAARSLEVGKFYEKQGKPKAAAIYYNEALKFGTAEASAEARERLAKVSAEFPDDVVDAKANPASDYTVPAAVDLKGRSDYAGPPAPELAKLSEKPKMRGDDPGFMPIPLQEPTLPTRPGTAPGAAPGSLLPPVTEKPLLLPVPPPPGTSAIPAQPAPPVPAPPAPEKPAEEKKSN